MNENDIKLIEFCKGRPKTITEIASHLGIAFKNVSTRLPRLEEEGFIEIKKPVFSKHKLVFVKQDERLEKEIKRLFQLLKDNNNIMSQNEFYKKAFENFSGDIEEAYYINLALQHIKFNEQTEILLKLKD